MTMAGVLLLSDDLIFTSRITGTAKDLGIPARWARNAVTLIKLSIAEAPDLVILDLANPGLVLPELLAALPNRPRVLAYGSHVDAESLKAARAAGCDLVLPRSAFVERLAEELRGIAN